MVIKKNDFYRYIPNDWKTFERHCREGIFCVQEIDGELFLVDTFWGYLYKGEWKHDGKLNTLEEILKKGSLEFICNLDEVNVISSFETKYYKDEDIKRVSRQHACTNNCVYYMVGKDIKKNSESIAEKIKAKIQDNNRTIKSYKSSNKRLAKDLVRVLNGDVENVYF